MIRVAYQGTTGSYSQQASARHFRGRSPELRGYDSFRAMLEAVQRGEADFGVLPIENTTAGSINEAYDLLATMGLSIVGEEVQPVQHCLLGLRGASVGGLRRVLSHPQALLQCTAFLGGLEGCEARGYTDTAGACEKVRDDADPTQGAIASEVAAELYDLAVLARDVADQRENYTRMVVVAREPAAVDPAVPCKTSILFATRHEHGALAACLQVLAAHRLNLTKLESRPRPHTPWQYLFYADFEGNVAHDAVQSALGEVAEHTEQLVVLGSYPVCRVPGE